MQEEAQQLAYLERRCSARFHSGLRAELILSCRNIHRVTVEEISMNGLHVSSDLWTAQHIVPPDRKVLSDEPIRATIRIKLPDDGIRAFNLTIFCEIASFTQLAKDRYQIGLKFLKFGGISREKLEAYIAQLTGN